MKRIISLLIITASLSAAPDCIDNSHHGAQYFDSGNYYLVATSEQGPCNCPCGRRDHPISWKARGKCLRCGHYRVPTKLPSWVKKELVAKAMRKARKANWPRATINIKKLAMHGKKGA